MYGLLRSDLVFNKFQTKFIQIPNIVKLRDLFNVLVNSWISLRNIKRGPGNSNCNGLIHHHPPTIQLCKLLIKERVRGRSDDSQVNVR